MQRCAPPYVLCDFPRMPPEFSSLEEKLGRLCDALLPAQTRMSASNHNGQAWKNMKGGLHVGAPSRLLGVLEC